MARRSPLRAVSMDDLEVVYRAWPAPEHDKTRLRALLLRIRLERLVDRLPTTGCSRVRGQVARRLLLSVGEEGLTPDDRARRHRVVVAATAAYRELCDFLHARRPDLHVSVQDIDSWAAAVAAIETELER
jgi:hypothetical protein